MLKTQVLHLYIRTTDALTPRVLDSSAILHFPDAYANAMIQPLYIEKFSVELFYSYYQHFVARKIKFLINIQRKRTFYKSINFKLINQFADPTFE